MAVAVQRHWTRCRRVQGASIPMTSTRPACTTMMRGLGSSNSSSSSSSRSSIGGWPRAAPQCSLVVRAVVVLRAMAVPQSHLPPGLRTHGWWATQSAALTAQQHCCTLMTQACDRHCTQLQRQMLAGGVARSGGTVASRHAVCVGGGMRLCACVYAHVCVCACVHAHVCVCARVYAHVYLCSL
jgi:hypothetical protein